MSRWLKIILSLGVLALVALGTLPWWLGVVLRPILRTQDITFGRYERNGYNRFKIHDAQYSRPGLLVTASEVQAPTPLVWTFQQLRGEKPLLTVGSWRLERIGKDSTTSEKKSVNGFADLERLLWRLKAPLHRWLPRAQLGAGELRGITPEITLTKAEWHDSQLSAEGLRIAGQELDVVISAATEGIFTVNAHTPANDTRLQLTWSEAEIKGSGSWLNQSLQVNARFGATGWLPNDASAAAQNWELPAARIKLGAPYALVRGDARLVWRDETFDLSLKAKASPGADTKAPPFEAEAAAHGNLREVTLTALQIDAPFATANLTAPVTFSIDRPLSASSAQLTLKADLAKMPWVDARGRVEGNVTVAGDSSAARQIFELEFSDVVVENHSLEKAQARGVLAWPLLTLEKLEARLDKSSAVTARGSIDWQTRVFSDVALEGSFGSAWFASWLPENSGWNSLVFKATMAGPLDAPQHQGSLKIAEVSWTPLQPMAMEATWRGVGGKIDFTEARAKAADSAIEVAGILDARTRKIELKKLAFSPDGQAVWQLAAPTELQLGANWVINQLQLTGSTSQLAFTGKGGTNGSMEINATAFDSAWLQDWITLTGPHWLLRTLQAQGRVVDGALVFDAALAAQIEMSPRPAEVKLNANGDAKGIQLKELTVTESNRVLTQASGRLPVSWKTIPGIKLTLDETAPLEFSATTDPDSPLWSALSAYSGLQIEQTQAKIALKGTLREPAGEVEIRAAKIGVSPKQFKFSVPDFSEVALSLQLGRNVVVLSRFSTKIDGQLLQASGRTPMSDERWQELWRNPRSFDWTDAVAQIEVADADLSILAKHSPDLIAPKGKLRAKVELAAGGKFSGELHLIDAASRPLPPFSTLQEINADLVLNDRTLSVQKLTAKLGGEPVELGGSITLVPRESPRLALSLKGKNLPLVRNTGLLVRNDIDLRADTDKNGVTRVTGLVTLRDCLVLANLGSLLPSGQRGVTRQPPYFTVAAEPFRTWPLAVEVRGPQSIRIRTTVFNGTASARFQLGGTLGEPRAVGEIALDQGQVLFPFATFEVQQGTLRLRESDPFHAVVNLNATSQRRDYQLRLEATGQLPSPNVVLSSTPSLEAEEVLLMVMTGQPPSNEPTTSSGAQRLALLGAYLGRGVFQDLGIGGEDRLEISAGEQVSRQGRETYEFEYKLGRRWSLTGEYDEFDNYNAGLKWRVYAEESKPSEKK